MAIQSIQKGSIFGGALLIAGCCIGAGMLGLPALSAMAGFQPSAFIFIASWLFMICTGFLLMEVNLWFGGNVSIISMAEKTLGLPGKIIAWFVFLFLFYSLMVAYVAASGSLVSEFVSETAGIDLHHSIGSFVFCALFGILLYLGMSVIDWFNRLFMLGLVITYVALVIAGIPHVRPELLKHTNWSAATNVLPVVITSFGFHNLIPSLTTYFHSDAKALKSSIFFGSLIPLLIYLMWEWIILGIVPLSYLQDSLNKGDVATEALKNVVGMSWILEAAQAFAFFAIVTSFLSVALSFMDFLSDGLKIKKTTRGKALLSFLVLMPPFLCALADPTIFFFALKIAGGFGAVILFGILPALMVWNGRYVQKISYPQIMPGGKFVLVGIIGLSLWVMLLQLL